ncbi:hypothetical protein E5D57_013777 [Metarhizium anisopliae]|nr:hypothetical protein E5D57_013777 [Metarhizium anisopliae]
MASPLSPKDEGAVRESKASNRRFCWHVRIDLNVTQEKRNHGKATPLCCVRQRSTATTSIAGIGVEFVEK